MAKKITSLDEALTAFIEGAIVHHAGMSLPDDGMANRGLFQTREGTNYIDHHSPNARDIFIPLLEHKDDAVRATAASALIHARPDLALTVLQHISDFSVTEAHMTAGMILGFKEVFGDYVMGLCPRDPRYPKPVETREDNARG